VTAGGLVFVATAPDSRLRAYDRETGEVLWSTVLPSGSEGLPATYELGGRQYLALPVGAGTGHLAPTFSENAAIRQGEHVYVVLALPRGGSGSASTSAR
jgi:quinoprotein glucose dehydrogenase